MQQNLLEYLENTAQRCPDAPAVIDENEQFTFGQLRDKARNIGTALCRLVGVHNRPVAVLTDRTAKSAVAFMGVLCSGNYYTPVDCKMPAERMNNLIKQLSPAALLFAQGERAVAETYRDQCPLICIDEAMETAADAALLSDVRRKVLDVDPAYIIFSSGSTGAPKGIVVSHRSVIDFTDWYVDTCGIQSTDKLGNQAPFYFDLSVKDLYSCMKTGAAMHILPKKFFLFPILLMRYLEENGITVLSWATSAFHLVANSGVLAKIAPQSLRRVIVGGEALQAKQLNLWRAALQNCQFINLYGPTEVTVDCCYHIIEKDYADTDTIPIGKACENMEVFLLDADGNTVADGQIGEICVRGSGLAQGYFGDPDKTNAVFTQDPRNPWYHDRIYHTGDMATVNEDGDFVFLARKDNQIKHAGYRIELGEIETAVNSLSGMQAAICFFDAARDRIHCVYQGELDAADIVKGARALIPKYMLPNVYTKVEQMPYNPNGKIDRVALKKEYLNEQD